MARDVRILITGGTLDKIHDPFSESLAFSRDGATQIPEILHYSRCHFPAVQQLMQIDSLDMTEDHREQIVSAIKTAKEKSIVITHGTSTMGETARFIAASEIAKTIVLTGAMRPFSLGFSDGPFNMGGAIVASQTLKKGVYGVMNGRIIEAQDLNKNTELGRFDA
ncbi:asparaginase domain-containing protein [Parvularcula sp. IMCC14364]|uniref:asparaginase domain-containing protein n=1 Tax=Parvularcula sp. IMCC14364 TaxID=3067902 RepID=UPI002740B4F1|nr:asparaginase domain-containing protein [Parvularcula sp. IMCC14364]